MICGSEDGYTGITVTGVSCLSVMLWTIFLGWELVDPVDDCVIGWEVKWKA